MNRLIERLHAIDQWLRSTYQWFAGLSEPRQGALIELAFHLGERGLTDMPRVLDCMRDGRFDEAETHVVNAKVDLRRAQLRLGRQIAAGEWQ